MDDIVFDGVIRNHTREIENEHNDQNYEIVKHIRNNRNKKMYHHYKCIADIYCAIRRKQSISCVRLRNGTFEIIIHCERKCNSVSMPYLICHIVWLDNLTMNGHTIHVDQNLNEEELDPFNEDEIESYMVGLPFLIQINKSSYYYWILY